MTKVVAIIQSRQGSTRLPGKALKPLFENKGALELMLERIAPSNMIDQLVVATTTLEQDTSIELLCQRLNVPCFRGSEHDVLDRYFCAAQHYKASHIVRLTADCPLHDYDIIDSLISYFLDASSPVDYAGIDTTSYPRGFDAEIFTIKTLAYIKETVTLSSDKEHVTPYIYHHPDQFKIKRVPFTRDVSHLRLTLDTPEDFDLLQHLASFVFGAEAYCHFESILDFLDQHPHLIQLNQMHERNEEYKKRLEHD